jgi:ubiquinone/menaquinone biosynthesis C-methylase UbiE
MQELESLNKGKWIPGQGGERMTVGIDYGWQMRDHMARYHFAVPYCQGKRVLDVATGTGYGADILRSRGALDVTAVDRDEDALGYAERRYGTKGVHWLKGDAYALQFDPGQFDVVVSYETIEHLKEPERFVRECKRVVKPGGLYIVSTPVNIGGPFVSEHHELEFSPGEFQELLGRYFSNIELYGQRRELIPVAKPLGKIPEIYRESRIMQGKGNPAIFKLLDRLNKVPSHVLAWAMGYGESIRSQIRPFNAPLAMTPLLQPHYYVMIAICRP